MISLYTVLGGLLIVISFLETFGCSVSSGGTFVVVSFLDTVGCSDIQYSCVNTGRRQAHAPTFKYRVFSTGNESPPDSVKIDRYHDEACAGESTHELYELY